MVDEAIVVQVISTAIKLTFGPKKPQGTYRSFFVCLILLDALVRELLEVKTKRLGRVHQESYLEVRVCIHEVNRLGNLLSVYQGFRMMSFSVSTEITA